MAYLNHLYHFDCLFYFCFEYVQNEDLFHHINYKANNENDNINIYNEIIELKFCGLNLTNEDETSFTLLLFLFIFDSIFFKLLFV